MKKRLLAAIMAAILAVGGAFGFVACGDDKPNGGNGNNTEQGGNQGGNEKPSDIPVTEVKLSKAELTLEEGESDTLTTTVLPDNATNKTVIWRSSEDSVATVKNGTVTAVSKGTATITATAGGKSSVCSVTVNGKKIEAEGVKLNKNLLYMQIGDIENLTATVSPANATEKDVAWNNTDDGIIAFNNGKVTALKTGKSTVTATVNGKSATCKITVIATKGEGFTMPEGGFDTANQVEISFYHGFGSVQSNVLKNYIEKFNKLYPNIKINAQAVGRVEDIRNQVLEDIKAGTAPDIAYCYPEHVAEFNRFEAVQALNGFLKNGEYKDYKVKLADKSEESLCFTQEQTNSFVEGYYGEGTEYGDGSQMLSLPLSKIAEVMYYNKTFFDKHDLTVPETWDEMEEVCKKIKEIDKNSIPIGCDSESNLFITMCEQLSSSYTSATGDNFLFDNDTNRSFVERIKGWYDKGYITTAQCIGGMYTSNLFTQQKAYMVIGSSSGARHHISPKIDGEYSYETGISVVPQFNPDKPKVISQGPSVCIFKQDDPQRVLASWLFVKYLTANVDFQAEFSSASNALPVLNYTTMLKNVTYAANLLTADGFKNLPQFAALVGLAQQEAYFTVPQFTGSATARQEVGNLMVSVLKGEKTIDSAFKDAVENCNKSINDKNEQE